MNTPTSNKSIITKSVLSFFILVIAGAIIYMYFDVFVLNTPSEVTKTQEELDNERRFAEMTAPPRVDIQLTEDRGSEIRSDLRTKPEDTSVSSSEATAARAELVN